MSRRSHSKLLVTQRALRDLQAIFDYSTERWGKRTAAKYLDAIETALERLKAQPDLLKPEPDLHPALAFYRINKHLLVCDTRAESIVLLTVAHASMDIPARLAELQPTLPTEVELLHPRVRNEKQKRT